MPKTRISAMWLLSLVLLVPFSDRFGVAARQVRINRYEATVQEDENAPVVVATVREVKEAPYPAAGYRPDRAFPLPGEEIEVEVQFEDAEEEGSGLDATTTSTAVPFAEFTTRTDNINDLETTTANYDFTTEATKTTELDERAGRNLIGADEKATPVEQPLANGNNAVGVELLPDALAAQTPAVVQPVNNNNAAAPVQPPVIFVRGKAPYPPAGYRPSRVFRLPTEEEEPSEQAEAESAASDKANHPVCGVSTNPLAPKPAAGAKDDPDAERVAITVLAGPAVVVARGPTAIPLVALRSQPLLVRPQMVVSRGSRPLVYATPLRTW